MTGKADEAVPQTGGAGYDPAQIVSKALLCFNNNYVSRTLIYAHHITYSVEILCIKHTLLYKSYKLA